MTGDLIVTAPQKGNPVFNFFKNLGVSIGDTAAQVIRFTSNIFSLDPGGAISNIGNIVDKRSADLLLEQFVERLPAVIEKGLHRKVNPGLTGTIGTYLTDSTLSEDEAAELLVYMLDQGDKQKKTKIIENLEKIIRNLKAGDPSLTTAQMGQRLRASMKRAIHEAPTPIPVLGNPFDEERLLAIQKAFFHSFIQDFGTTYVRGMIKEPLVEMESKGLSVSSLSDTQLKTLIDDSLNNVNFRKCYTSAKDLKQLALCEKWITENQTRLIGQILSTATPWLQNGSLKIDLKVPGQEQSQNLNKPLLDALRAESHSIHVMRDLGDPAGIKTVGNSIVRSVGNHVGTELVSSWVTQNVSDPEKAASIYKGASTLIHEFTDNLELISDEAISEDIEVIRKYLSELSKGVASKEPNTLLDQKLRGPFEKTLQSPTGRQALLDIFLSSTPFNNSARKSMHALYGEYVKNGHWPEMNSPSVKAQIELLKSFESSVTRVAKIPQGMSTLSYLKALAARDSSVLKDAVLDMNPGTRALFQYLTLCDSKDPACSLLSEEHQKYIDQLRDARLRLRNSGLIPQCDERFDGLVNTAFNFSKDKIKEITSDPMQILLAYQDEESQKAVNCVLVGMALKGSLAQNQIQHLYMALESQRAQNPSGRAQIVQELSDYLKHKNTPEAAVHQKKLLTQIDRSAKEVVKGVIDRNLEDKASGHDLAARALQNSATQERTRALAHRFVDHTQLLDPETPQSLEDYARHITSVPPSAFNSPIDQSLQEGLNKTLQDPQTRKDMLHLGMSFNDALAAEKGAFIGPGLKRRLIETYEKADLSQDPPRFAAGTPAGIASFLNSFDRAARSLGHHRGRSESVLNFFQRAVSPNSRIADSLLAENSKGLSDLIMGMLKCDQSNADLCQSCLGSKGNWILPGKNAKAAEVLLHAPAGQVMQLLKLGLRVRPNWQLTQKCQKAIPSFLESVIAQAGNPQNSSSVLKDPSLFLEALKASSNQTALNCILSSYAEEHVFAPLRSKGVSFETNMRNYLSWAGVAEDSGLNNLTGDSLLESLERHNHNKKMLELKENFVNATRDVFISNTREKRRALAKKTSELVKGSFLATVTDPEFSHQIVAGKNIPQRLRTLAETNAMAQELLRCVERTYSGAVLPAALYFAEDLSAKFMSAANPWIESSKPLSTTHEASAPIPSSPDSSAEVCNAQQGIFGLQLDKIAASLTTTGASSSPAAMWAGPYSHTLKLHQEIASAQPMSTLSSVGQERILSRASEYRTLLNHIQTRERVMVMASNKGVTGWLGNRVFEVQQAGSELVSVSHDVRKLFTFPEEKIVDALENFNRDGSDKNRSKLVELMKEHCPAVDEWHDPKPLSMRPEYPPASAGPNANPNRHN